MELNVFARLGTALFGGARVDPADDVDAALLNQCVDAIVEAVDPRLRLMPRYRKRLAPSATAAIRFLRSLAPRLPTPIALSRSAWATDAYVGAFFATAADVQACLNQSTELHTFFRDPANLHCDRAYSILGMRRVERTVLASALVEGEVRRDVAQTTLGFTGHALVVLSDDPSTTRALLGEAILKRIARLALERIVSARDRAVELETRKSMKAARLRMLKLRSDGLRELSANEQDPSAEIGTLERELKAAAADHLEMRTSLATLDYSFDQIDAILGEVNRYVGMDAIDLRVTHTGYKLASNSAESGSELHLNELWVGTQLRAVIAPVCIPRTALAP